MSDMSKHVIVGDALGDLVAPKKLPAAVRGLIVFTLGVLSHGLMDRIDPDYTVNWFNPMERHLAVPFLIAQITGVLIILWLARRQRSTDPYRSSLRMWGIVGAVAPDMIDGVYSILNPAAWYQGHLLLPWHANRGSIPRMSMTQTLALSLVLLAIRFAAPPTYRAVQQYVNGRRTPKVE